MALDPSFTPRKKTKLQPTPPAPSGGVAPLGGQFTPSGFVPNKRRVVLPTDQAPYRHGQSPVQRATKVLAQTGEVNVVDQGATNSDAQRYAQTKATQRMLNAHGANLIVDGQWGPRTEAAYQAFLHHTAQQAVAAQGVDASRLPGYQEPITPQSVARQVALQHEQEARQKATATAAFTPYFEGQKPWARRMVNGKSVAIYKNPNGSTGFGRIGKAIEGFATMPYDITKQLGGDALKTVGGEIASVFNQNAPQGSPASFQLPNPNPSGQDLIARDTTALGLGLAHPATDLAAIVTGRKHGTVSGVLSDVANLATFVSPALVIKGAKAALALRGIKASDEVLRAAATATDPIESASRDQVIAAIQDAPHITSTQQGNTLQIMDTIARVQAQEQGITPGQAWDALFSGARYEGRAPSADELLSNAFAQMGGGDTPPWHSIPPEKAAKNLKAKLNTSAGRMAAASQQHDLVSPVHGIRVLGQPSFQEWLGRVMHSTPDVRQQILDATWYERLAPVFKDVFGDGYEPVLRAFGASQANAGPHGGMVSLLRAIERIERGAPIKQEYGSIGSVVADQIEQAYRGVTLTKGQAAKLSDFIDAIRGMKTRSWMGHDPLGGMPAPSDIWSARDAGYLDKKIASKSHHHNYIVERHGVDLRSLPADLPGAPSGTRYERISAMYNDFAGKLNEIAYHGRADWTPAQAQAMGWAAMQRFYGRPISDIREWVNSGRAAASKNIARDQGIEASRALEGQSGVHVVQGTRREIMDMQPNADYLYHGTNAQGAEGILRSGRIEARPTERNPENPAAWLTENPARAAVQGDHVIAIPRENLVKQGLSSHPLGMYSSPEDVHIYGDPLDTTTAQVHSESVPQPDLHPAANARYEALSPAQKAEYAAAVDRVALGAHFEEIVGADRVGSHFGVGVWRGAENPGLAAHVHVEKLTPEEVTKMNAVASAYGMAKNQGSVSWGRPLSIYARNGDNVFPAILTHQRATGALGAQVDKAVGDGLVGVIHGPGDTTYLVDFSGKGVDLKALAPDGQPLKWQGGYTIDERLKTEPWETTFQDAINSAPNSDMLKNAIEHVNAVVGKIGDRVFPAPGLEAQKTYDAMLQGILDQRGLSEGKGFLTAADRQAAEEILHGWANKNPDNPLAQQFQALSEAAQAARNSLDPEHYFTEGNSLFGSMERAQGVTQMLRQEGEAAIKGMVTRSEDMQHFLTLFQGADTSTVLHELAHAVEKWLPDMGLSEEELARSVEQYFRLGVAPNEALRGPMQALAKDLAQIYHHENVPGHNLNPEVGAALDRLLTGGKSDRYRIVDAHDPNAKTLWHNGQEITIADANRMMGEGDPFHLHVLDEHGNVVGARHGTDRGQHVHLSSTFVKEEHRRQGLNSRMSTLIRQHAGDRPITSEFMNRDLRASEVARSQAEGRPTGKIDMATTFFQHDLSPDEQKLLAGMDKRIADLEHEAARTPFDAQSAHAIGKAQRDLAQVKAIREEILSGRGGLFMKDGAEIPAADLAKLDPETLGRTYTPLTDLTPEQQLRQGLKGAKSQYGKEKANRLEEQRLRMEEAGKAITGKGDPAEEIQAAKAALRGPYTQIDFQGLSTLDPAALRHLKQYANGHPGLHTGQKIRLNEALDNAVYNGKVPRPNELRLIEHVFGPVTARGISNVAEQGGWDKFFNFLNVPRSLMATADVSAGLRQALVAGAAHPIIWGKAWPAYIKSIKSGEHYETYMQSVKNDPWYNHALAGGVSFTDLGEGTALAAHEEAFASDYAARIPGIGHAVKGSARGYTAFLNKIRMDAFAQQMRIAAAAGRDVNNEAFLTKIADVVNASTGRGTIHGRLEHILPALNTMLFSPRLMLSRLNYLDPTWYYRLGHGLSPAEARQVRMEALRGLFAASGAVVATLTLASQIPGVKVELDPTSSDFGKIHFGNTRVDVAGGFQQYVHLAGMLIENAKTNSTTGVKRKFDGSFGSSSRWDEIQNFVYNKFAPVPGMIRDVAKGHDAVGNSLGAYDWKEAATHFTPLVGQDALDLFNDRKRGLSGLAWAVGGYGLGAVGVGMQTYSPKNPASKPTKTLQGYAKKAGVELPHDVLIAVDRKAHLDAITAQQTDPRKRLDKVIQYYAQVTGDHQWDHLIGQDGITDEQAKQGVLNFRHALVGKGLSRYEAEVKKAAEAKK